MNKWDVVIFAGHLGCEEVERYTFLTNHIVDPRFCDFLPMFSNKGPLTFVSHVAILQHDDKDQDCEFTVSRNICPSTFAPKLHGRTEGFLKAWQTVFEFDAVNFIQNEM